METTIDPSRNAAGLRRFSPLAMGCALVLGVAATLAPVRQAQATGFPVVDISSIIESIEQFMQQVQQWETAYNTQKQYIESTMAKYQSLLTSINVDALKFQGGTNQLKEVSADYMVKQRCRTNSQSLKDAVMGLIPSLDLLGDGDSVDMNQIRDMQVQICATMQRTRNQQFNASVRFAQESLPKMQELMDKAKEANSESKESGDVGKAGAEATAINGQLDQQMRDYEAQMAAYKGYLDSLQNSQVALAEMALKGSGTTMLGTTVRTTALMKAMGVSAGDIVP